jgi:signal transduction histidine kinase
MSETPEDVAKTVSDVRHEINNALMAILGYLEIILGRTDLPPDVATKLRNVETEAFRIRDEIARTGFIRKP